MSRGTIVCEIVQAAWSVPAGLRQILLYRSVRLKRSGRRKQIVQAAEGKRPDRGKQNRSSPLKESLLTRLNRYPPNSSVLSLTGRGAPSDLNDGSGSLRYYGSGRGRQASRPGKTKSFRPRKPCVPIG